MKIISFLLSLFIITLNCKKWSEKSYSRNFKNYFDVRLAQIQLFGIIELTRYFLFAIISRNDFSPDNKRKQRTMISHSSIIRSSIFLPWALGSKSCGLQSSICSGHPAPLLWQLRNHHLRNWQVVKSSFQLLPVQFKN